MSRSKWLEQNATGIFMSLAIIVLAGVLLVDSRMRDRDLKDKLFQIDRRDTEAHKAQKKARESAEKGPKEN